MERWDRAALERGNLADMSVLAHRPTDLRFDGRVNYFADWDLFLRLSERFEPSPIPVVASLYFTSSESRMSDGTAFAEREREEALIQEGIVARRRGDPTGAGK